MECMNEIITYSQGPSAYSGIYVKDIGDITKEGKEDKIKRIINHTHRDDYYVIAVVKRGVFTMDCEFDHYSAGNNSILIVKPYQIHSVRSFSQDFQAFFLGVQDYRIPNELNYALYTLSAKQQLLYINDEDLDLLSETFILMRKYLKRNDDYKTHIINGLFTTALYKICSLIQECESKSEDLKILSQPASITASFKRLISHESHLNLPSYFADKLNITTAHLNDCVKKTTGQTVSYWLKKSIIDEAKRLLYYTDKSVKEIAFDLGFEDHTYFSRMFKKHTYQTPLQFRAELR